MFCFHQRLTYQKSTFLMNSDHKNGHCYVFLGKLVHFLKNLFLKTFSGTYLLGLFVSPSCFVILLTCVCVINPTHVTWCYGCIYLLR